MNTCYAHEHTLCELGLLDSYNLMIDSVGWRGLITGCWDTYLGLVLEFLSSVELVKVPPQYQNITGGDMRFGLGNVDRRMGVDILNTSTGCLEMNLGRRLFSIGLRISGTTLLWRMTLW